MKKSRYALLLGAAPSGRRQEKIKEMYDFLSGGTGGAWACNEIIICDEGISEGFLSVILENTQSLSVSQLFLYVCSCNPQKEELPYIELGKYIIHKSIFENLLIKRQQNNLDTQIIFDFCPVMIEE